MVTADDISGEVSIVWLEDVERFDYVRQTLVEHPNRRGRIRPPTGRAVGYAELGPDVPLNTGRRVFWVKEHDRSEDVNGRYATDCPTEAVDPRTISPGVPGEVTSRALGSKNP